MPNNWKTYKLEDALEALIDYRGKTPKKKNSGIPLITAKIVKQGKILEPNEFIAIEDYNGWMTRGIPEIGDVVLTTEAPLGEVAQLKNSNIALAQRIVTLRGKKNFLDNGYLKYFLQSNEGQKRLIARESGTTVAGIKQSELRKVLIDFPLFQEQQSIASILSAIDDKIENNLAINKTLEEMAMALYKHWFVDFGPFQDGEFVESELGMIPKGWEVKRLDEVAYKRAESYKFKGKEKVVFVNTGDVLDGSFLHKNYMDIDDLPGQAKKAIYPEDILFSEIRPINRRFAYVDFASQDYVVSTKFMVIRNNELINNKLLYRILTRNENLIEFQNIAESRSGTFPQITFDVVGHIQMILPNIEIQEEFQSVVGNWEEQQQLNLKEIKTLTQLRDTLLPQLISGTVRLKEFRE